MTISLHGARFSALALALSAAFAAQAQTDSVQQMKEVVVTATRNESEVSALISDVSVIGRAEIEASGGRTLTEVIARYAGVRSASNGGLGKNSSLYIRGTESRHVLLLVDGVRYGSSTTGTPNFDTIPLEMIDHIEVLKGPASALYGSDAIGGVVQIFTKKGYNGVHPYVSLTAGEYNHTDMTAGVNGGTSEFTYAVGVQSLYETGFSSTNKALTSYNPDNDGLKQNSANTSIGWNITEGWKFSANALQSDGVSQYDSGLGGFDTRNEFSTNVLSMALEGQLTSIWKSKLMVGNGVDQFKNYTSSTPSKFKTAQDQLTWQNDVTTPWGTLVLGWDSLKEAVSGSTVYAVNNRTTNSQFVGLSGSAGAHSWQASARHDNNSQFGDANTGLLGYGYAITDDLRARASYGTTFKAPTFNNLYFPVSGNATTQPETGRNTEVGISWGPGAHLFSLTYFTNRIQGYITTLPVVTNTPYAKIEGWTLSHEGSFGDFTFHNSFDFLNARNELTGLRLQRRPEQQLTSSVDYQSGKWSFGTSLLATSDFYDDAANKLPLGGYATLDLHAGYEVDRDWRVEARVINAGDKFYQTALGYNQSGRAAYVTLRYEPK